MMMQWWLRLALVCGLAGSMAARTDSARQRVIIDDDGFGLMQLMFLNAPANA